MDNPKINQVVKYKGKRWKVVELLDEARVKIKCMVCSGKFAAVFNHEISAA